MGVLRHFQGWWSFRHLPNILLVHFADLLAETSVEIRRIASFLDIAASDEQTDQIAQQTHIGEMRSRAEQNLPRMAKTWKEGARSFFYKGTNGRWKDVLTDEELAMYERTATMLLEPDCRVWLERG